MPPPLTARGAARGGFGCVHDKKRPVEGEHLSTGRWFLSFKPHGIASQHLLTGNLSGVLRGKRRSGIDGLLRGRVCGQRFANAYAVRAAGNKAPLERTVAEFLFHRDRLGRAQFLRGMKEKAACVVLFCWAAALDPDAGKADIQKIRDKARGFPVLLKGHVIPEGNIESASNAVFFCGGIEFYISCFSVPNLRVDAQHGPKRRKPIRQERPKPVLLHAVGHQNCSTFIVLSLSIQCFPAAQNNAPARRQTGAQRLPQPQRSARRAGASCRTRAYLCGKYPVRLERLRLEDCQNSGQFPHKTVRCPPQRNMQAEDLQNPPPCSHKTPVAFPCAVRGESSSARTLPCAVGMRIVRTRISRSGSIKRIAAPFFVRKHQLNRSW